ncbi:MAG: vWA domain-containing protein [Candidatus Woesearchaeota archaeon]
MLPSTEELELKDKNAIEEEKGKLASDDEEDKLLHSVLENDSETIDDGKLVNESFNQGVSTFTPDIVFENIVQSYSNAEKIYGPKLIKLLTGYNPDYIKKNVHIPEFTKELRAALAKRSKELKKRNITDNEGEITSHGIHLASLILYTEELDALLPKGFLGNRDNKKDQMYGEHDSVRNYKNHDRFRDIALKRTIKRAISRGRTTLSKEDLKISEKKSKGVVEIIYALDASGSMRGIKIDTAKKAGIALAFRAIENRDKVGLVVFGADIKESVSPTTDFTKLLSCITEVRATQETNFTATIEKAIQLFSNKNCSKHLIIITDAVPTVGEDPEREAYKTISQAASLGITTSIVGIGLDDESAEFARRATALANGRMYAVKPNDRIDAIILQDYDAVRN